MAKKVVWACDYCNKGVEFTSIVKQLVDDHEQFAHKDQIFNEAIQRLLHEVRGALRDDATSRLEFLESQVAPHIWAWVMRQLETEARRGGATRVRFCVKGRHDKCPGYWYDGLRCACTHHVKERDNESNNRH